MERARFMDRRAFGVLLERLVDAGYELIGPTVRDGAIVLERIEGPDDLPRGVGEEQVPGGYRLVDRGDDRLFAWAHGPDSARRFLFPPREPLARATRDHGRLAVEPTRADEPPLALVGLRPCDLHGVLVQDRVFLDVDPGYRRRREGALLIGVSCGEPGGTCFCVSMGTGPACTTGFDLALTELPGGFVVRVGSPRGEEVLAEVGRSLAGRAGRNGEPEGVLRWATRAEVAAAGRVVREAAGRMGRELDTSDLPGLLYRNREHPRWRDAAARCLACANCTMVCPTCFCHDVVDGVDLPGHEATRVREWASCFSEEFSHVVGGPVRRSREARYPQWLTHKFASWIDQFGTSGCVGCGRCITWCPVGIDVTEEIAAIRATDGATGEAVP